MLRIALRTLMSFIKNKLVSAHIFNTSGTLETKSAMRAMATFEVNRLWGAGQALQIWGSQ